MQSSIVIGKTRCAAVIGALVLAGAIGAVTMGCGTSGTATTDAGMDGRVDDAQGGNAAISPTLSTLIEEHLDPLTADNTHQVTITATILDIQGSPVAGKVVTFSVSGLSNTLVQPAGPTNALGQASGTLTSTSAGLKQINASVDDDGTPLALANSLSVEFVPGAPAKLSIYALPSNASLMRVINDTTGAGVHVAVLDADGNVVNGDSERTITMSLGGNLAGGTLLGNTAQIDMVGVAVFDDLKIDKAAKGYTLIATSAGLESDESLPFDIDPHHLRFVNQPGNVSGCGEVKTSSDEYIKVEVLDSQGDLVIAATNEVTLSVDWGVNPPIGPIGICELSPTECLATPLSGQYSRNAVSGVATFSDQYTPGMSFMINCAGSGVVLIATSPDVLQATSNPFTPEV